jgi:hypothetical protein
LPSSTARGTLSWCLMKCLLSHCNVIGYH